MELNFYHGQPIYSLKDLRLSLNLCQNYKFIYQRDVTLQHLIQKIYIDWMMKVNIVSGKLFLFLKCFRTWQAEIIGFKAGHSVIFHSKLKVAMIMPNNMLSLIKFIA